jgi:hypothetical protein
MTTCEAWGVVLRVSNSLPEMRNAVTSFDVKFDKANANHNKEQQLTPIKNEDGRRAGGVSARKRDSRVVTMLSFIELRNDTGRRNFARNAASTTGQFNKGCTGTSE